MKLLSRIIVLLCLATLINSCKRDVKESAPTSLKGDLPADLAMVIKEQGHSVYIPINKSVPGILTNAQGVEIQTRKRQSDATLKTPDAICADPSLAVVGPHTLIGITHTLYDCTNLKHSLTVSWTIRSSFDLAMTNPNNTSQISKGRIRIKSGTTIIFQDLAIPLSTLTYTGDDPNEPGVKLYTLNFTLTNIDNQYLSPGSFTSVEASAVAYTDCTSPYDTYLLTTAYTTAYVPGLGTAVCSRIDQVYISPSTPSTPPPTTGDCASIAGSYVVNSPGVCQNYTPNMASQVMVKKEGDPDANNVNIQAKLPGTSTYSTDGFVYYWEIRYIKQLQDYVPNTTASSFPGRFTFRWRNVNGTGSSTCYGPWSNPVTYTVYDF